MYPMSERRFPDPHEIATPPGCEGWEEWIPEYLRFRHEHNPDEDNRFYFQDSLHWPEPMKPLDMWFIEVITWTYNLPHTRFIRFPMVKGTQWRILNGYVYLGALPVLDPKEQEERLKYFRDRAQFYFDHWDELYEKWELKIKAVIDEVESLKLDVELPEVTPFDKDKILKGEAGLWPSPAWRLVEDFHKLKLSLLKAWEIHFEMLNVGYAAYGAFMDFASKLFPGIEKATLTRMLAGVRFYFAETQGQLRRLAELAVKLGLSEVFEEAKSLDEALRKLEPSDAGKEWIKDFEETRRQWFNMWAGSGTYFCGKGWREDPTPILETIKGYIKRVKEGVSEKPVEEVIQERDRLVEEYVKLIRAEEDQRMFLQLLELARRVVRYVENHKWWVENWYGQLFRIKMLELGETFTRYGILDEPEDIAFLTIYEVEQALMDLAATWALEEKPRSSETKSWSNIVRRRKEVWRKLTGYRPPPGLGPVPPITDPFLEQLWGITKERIESWLEVKPEVGVVKELKGFAGAPGVVEGVAKVIKSPDELHLVEHGDILVAPLTDPSWTSVFPKVRGIVTNVGGIMSHAAIVGREYGIPVVVGTGTATDVIKTGQRIRVDGTKGVVSILE